MIGDDITTRGVPMVPMNPAKVAFTPVAQIALIICEEMPKIAIVDACRIAVALQTEGYCKAPF